jgi:hypothetical protein
MIVTHLRRLAVLLPLAAGLAVPLAGCATPEELAIQQQRRERALQTGSNIARSDGRGSTDAVTNRDAQDSTMNDLRNTSLQSLYPKGPSQ